MMIQCDNNNVLDRKSILYKSKKKDNSFQNLTPQKKTKKQKKQK